jgi:hypothetical protein
VLVCLTAVATGTASTRVTILRNVSLELVGEVNNTPAGVVPAASTQFGYVSYLLGLPVFAADPNDETTAVFTFYIEAATLRVLTDGPLRVVTRQGTMTVYRNPAGGASFDSPDTFRRGTPILVAGFRQQVVIDTVTGGFTTRNANEVTAATPFPAGSRELRLGTVGQEFDTVLTGHVNMPGPPSAWFAGYTYSTR